MTLQTLDGPIWLPPARGIIWNGVPSFFENAYQTLLDAPGEIFGMIVPCTKVGTISKVHFRTKTVTTGGTVNVRVETVAGYNPSGNLWGENTKKDGVVIGDSDDDTWFAVTLDAGAVISASDLGKPIAIATVAPAGFSGNLNIANAYYSYVSLGPCAYDARCHTVQKTLLWAATVYEDPDQLIALKLEYSDGSFCRIPKSLAMDGYGQVYLETDRSPDEVGVKLRFPITFRACGAYFDGYLKDDWTLKVYDSADVLKASYTYDNMWQPGGSNKYVKAAMFEPFTVNANEWYRITAVPETATQASRVYYLDQAVSAQWGIYGLNQDNQKWTERTDGGAWTDRDGRILFWGFLADQFHDSSATVIASHRKVR
jgi:hypothetical protein